MRERVSEGAHRKAGLRHKGGPVDELLDVAVERPVLDQLEVEVGPASWKIGSSPV
jgi:hypothetical protein